MKTYLCGPMTLNVAPNQNAEAFQAVAADLRSRGHEVFNPADFMDLTYEQGMRLDIQAVLAADAVVVLPRWAEGVGTRVEVAVAIAVGTPVYSWYPDGLISAYGVDAGRDALRALLDGAA